VRSVVSATLGGPACRARCARYDSGDELLGRDRQETIHYGSGLLGLRDRLAVAQTTTAWETDQRWPLRGSVAGHGGPTVAGTLEIEHAVESSVTKQNGPGDPDM
jgi:hypothetical protein